MTENGRRFLLAVAGPPVAMTVVLLSLWLAVPGAALWRSPLPGPSHVYSPLEPRWSQAVFPSLGAPTAAVVSMSSAGPWLAAVAPAKQRAGWLAGFSAGCHATAVLLFAWLLFELGIQPLLVGGAALGFAFSPAMWTSALVWRPYVALLPLSLLVALLTARGVNRNELRVWAIGLVLGLGACESLAALPLVAAWPWVVRTAASRQHVRVPRTAWLVTALALAVGGLLQALSAAIAWRALPDGTRGASATWRAAIGTVTSGWQRLFFTYLPESLLTDSVALAREWLSGTSLLGALLAVAGAAWCWERWRGGNWLGLGLLSSAYACSVLFGAPVSDAKPLVPLLVAGGWLYAAGGLEWVRARGAAPVAVVAVVVALGVMGRVSSVVEAGNIDGPGFDDTLDRLLEEIREPAAMVADSAEVDRRLVSAMARAAPSSRWVRVSQHSASVRQALNESRRVFAWGGSANRLEAAGWVLESPREWTVTSPARRVIRLWGLGRQAPCLIVGPAGWTDLTPLASFGALGVQSTADPPAHLDLQYWASTALTLEAHDVVSGRSMNVRQVAEPQGAAPPDPGAARTSIPGGGAPGGVLLRLTLDRVRGHLAVARFSRPPDRVLGSLRVGRRPDTVRVCAVPTEGELVSLDRAEAMRDLDIGSPRLFGDGWYEPESAPGGDRLVRWSGGTSPSLRLLFLEPPGPFRVEVDAQPVREDPGLSLGLSVNGRALPTRPMAGRVATYTWVVDAARLRAGLNVLELSGPALVSPEEASGLPDDRQLGFMVTAIRVGPSRGAPEAGERR